MLIEISLSTFEWKMLHSNFRCPSGSLAQKSLHFNYAFFFACPVDAVLHIQNIAENKNINVEKMLLTSKLKPSRSHRTHIYCIF